jgi:hypothetical protein
MTFRAALVRDSNAGCAASFLWHAGAQKAVHPGTQLKRRTGMLSPLGRIVED